MLALPDIRSDTLIFVLVSALFVASTSSYCAPSTSSLTLKPSEPVSNA